MEGIKMIESQTTMRPLPLDAKKTSHSHRHVHHHHEAEAYKFHEVKWHELMVGDIVKIENDQQIPADVILLSTSDEKGLAYVETANLDGEKNLKLKQAREEFKNLIDKVSLQGLKGAMLIDRPNSKIHQFKGVVELEGLDTIYLNYSNILLRGTHLKNTDYVIGMVVYTGPETKLMRNQGFFRNKKSHVEYMLNKYILGVFFIQIILCIILTVVGTIFYSKYEDPFTDNDQPKLSYLFAANIQTNQEASTFVQGLTNFGAFLILLNTMIPISLMVSLELTKFFQSLGINLDDLLKEGDQRAKVLNMLIHEDLAKIEYIFADKTGTLTTNEMKFTSCTIDGNIYTLDILRSPHSPSSPDTPHTGTAFKSRKSNNYDNEKEEELQRKDSNVDLFWLCLSLCHDVIIDKKDEESPHCIYHYHGSSPDEVELVTAASEFGYIFAEKRAEEVTVLIHGKPRKFVLEAKIDFSSDRKRMSVVMRDEKTGKLYLFCKGADSLVLQRVSKDCSLELIEKTKDDLKNFSKEGLRTLAIAYNEVDKEMFKTWQKKYTSLQQQGYNIFTEEEVQYKLIELEEQLERDLLILGGTALEDRLQEGVSETINDLHRAGIKIWMLTGDKLETAENIGYSTSLLANDTKVFKVGTTSPEETLEKYEKIRDKMRLIKEVGHAPFSIGEDINDVSSVSKFTTFALIVDGEAISYTFHNDSLKNLFLEMIPEFRTVICCRSTPNQKADVVDFVKKNLKKMTMAIGDGGNDVNMIQRADVGIGIFGKEGNQAAFASDYAIGRFSFLWRLLFVHGRWAYLRSTNFINFFFYKNLIFTLPQFWFAIYSGFSGQSIYSDIYMTNYNTIFTSVAPVYYASLEQDVNPRENETIRRAMPYLYADFRKRNLFSFQRFLFFWCTGIIHSIAIYYIVLATMNDTVNSSGLTLDLWGQSLAALSAVFCTVFSVVIIGTNHFNIFTTLCYFVLTLLAYFPVGTMILDQFDTPMQHDLIDIISTPVVWTTMLLIVAVCSLTVYVPKVFLFHFKPSLVEMLQKDRNRKWKQKHCEVYEKVDDPNSPCNKFDFNSTIILAGWNDVKIQTEKASPYKPSHFKEHYEK